MLYRHASILANKDLGASGTEPISITISDPISAITIVHLPVGGSNTPAGHPVKNIEQIDLKDGSDLLYSCTGFQGQALNVFESKEPIIQEVDARTGGTPLTYVHLHFGRWLWDKELALDPKRHNNLDLYIKWNEVNYDASCTSHGFVVYGHVMEDPALSPVGFLMSKQQRSYEPSSGAWESTNLPGDYPIRKLILKGLKAGAGIRGLIQEIKVDEDLDKRIIIDGDIHELRSFLDQYGGDCIDVIRGNVGTSSVYYYCTPSNVFSHSSDGDTAARVIASGLPIGGRLWIIAETGTTGFSTTVRGKNPHGCVQIPFGNQDDMTDWWNLTGGKKGRVRVKGGTSSASGDTVEVVTQQLRRY